MDYVRLYLDLESPAVNERHKWNYELCDDRLTTTALDKYYSSTSFLLMAFHADKFASNRTGFSAFYRFIDKRKYIVSFRKRPSSVSEAKQQGKCTRVRHDSKAENRPAAVTGTVVLRLTVFSCLSDGMRAQ